MKTGRTVWMAGLLAALVAATAAAQSEELRARAAEEGYVLTPAGSARAEEGPSLFPVEYDLEEGEPEGIYWPWGQKWPGMALGLKAGTTGAGAELTFGINRWLNLRGGYNWFTIDPTFKVDEAKYKGDIDLDSVSFLLDLHPFGGVFRLTGGAYYYTDGTALLDATPKKDWTRIGNHRYQPASIGTISGSAEMDNDFVPYLGIGWGNSVADDAALTLSLDLGVIFQSYTVSPLTSTGSGATSSDPTFRRDLEKERKRLQDDLDDWQIYPVVTLSLAYHF